MLVHFCKLNTFYYFLYEGWSCMESLTSLKRFEEYVLQAPSFPYGTRIFNFHQPLECQRTSQLYYSNGSIFDGRAYDGMQSEFSQPPSKNQDNLRKDRFISYISVIQYVYCNQQAFIIFVPRKDQFLGLQQITQSKTIC